MGENVINKIFLIVKKFILSVLFIYGFNIMIFPLNITIPINIFSIIMVIVFGLPAVFGFCLFSIFVF